MSTRRSGGVVQYSVLRSVPLKWFSRRRFLYISRKAIITFFKRLHFFLNYGTSYGLIEINAAHLVDVGEF